MPTGTIYAMKYDRGYGFILKDAGPEPGGSPQVFFHLSGLASRVPFAELIVGQKVDFEETFDAKSSRPRAVNVVVL